MLFSHSQNGVTDCKGASVGQDMWAGKCCCASTRVFPASSGAAEHARLTEQQQPQQQRRRAAGGAPRPAADFNPDFRRELGKAVGWGTEE